MNELHALAWPASRLADGAALLARLAGLPLVPSELTNSPQPGIHANVPDEVVRDAVQQMGLELEAVETNWNSVRGMVQGSAPSILTVDTSSEPYYLLLVGRGRRAVDVIDLDGRRRSVAVSTICKALFAREAVPIVAETERLVDEIRVNERRRRRLIDAIVHERLRARRIRRCWLIRIPPGTSFWVQCASVGMVRSLVLLVASHIGEYLLWIASWTLVARLVFAGRLDTGWLAAWALTLAVAAAVHVNSRFLAGRIALELGALLKKRLLQGALRLDADEIRREGVGRLLGRTFEAQAVETLALSGGLSAMLAMIQLVFAAVVLIASGPVLPALLTLWIGVGMGMAVVYRGRRLTWTDTRIAMTHDLIERMLGYRTQLAQQNDDDWHRGEDERHERYVDRSREMDRAAVRIAAVVPRGWLLIAFFGLSPALVGVTAPSTLALTIGGILLAFRGFKRLTMSVASIVGAEVAWRQTGDVFHAAARAETPARRRPATRDSVLQAEGVAFRHAGRSEPVLDACSVSIARDDRIVLRGSSGSGKSTFAAVCAGLRVPSAGLMLLHGLDAQTVGFDEWRRRVILVPQFHENHVLLGTFAFNLLLGVQWPPHTNDLAAADRLCRELGLGDLIDRMPGGLMQMVGETGWQLSHGERSRLFLARALLQQPDFLILDETFAQLDPLTIRRALDVVVQRQPTVMLIAHT